MTIEEVERGFGNRPQVGALWKSLENASTRTLFLQGLVASAPAMLFASMFLKTRRMVLFILDDGDEAGYFYHDLTQLLGEKDTYFFPSSYRRAVKYCQRDAGNEILRTEVLARLASSDGDGQGGMMVVTYPEALAELVISRKILNDKILRLSVGQVMDPMEVVRTLRDYGFQETDYVYEPGQFARRGSILDVYSYSSEYPFRIDFFGDEVDTIRTFEVEDQLSKEKREELEIVPELVREDGDRQSFLDLMPSNALLVMKDYAFVCERIGNIFQEGFSDAALVERMEGATEQEMDVIRRDMMRELNLCSSSLFQEGAGRFQRLEYGVGVVDRWKSRVEQQGDTQMRTVSFHTTPQPLFHKNFELLKSELERFLLKGYTIYILADSEKQTQRLTDIFAAEEGGKKYDINFTPVNKTLHEGFVDDDWKVCVFTDHQIFDRFHKYNLKSDVARAGKMALTMKELQQMEPGDYIVHVDYGIGKFGGLVRVPTGNSYHEMIRILYAHDDVVDVSIHSLYKISKYRSSATGEPPRLSTLGTGAWERVKERAKKHIKDIARDLIKLYATRRRERGFAFHADTYMQHELEAGFLYEDTPDQMKATQEVKADMEAARPMDRLVCGDVGFGKTEVAMRAAFKAASDSKQVAVLVPTTVLAFQHYQTFSKRLKDFPVRVEYLSRARSVKDTKAILSDLEKGSIDILIGTHKLISKTVKWKDLGLLIIDEEQKFGVSTKEKLRQLKTNVDTLTMSATPIPRTLQFSLMGARDMSVIRTPPPNRYPIQTELTTFNMGVIRDAINFEMSRNGQVYFVNDRISRLTELRMMIEKAIPDCRVAIGHG